jgi:hypothetical protein
MLVNVPDVPVTVTVAVPSVAVPLAVSVRVLDVVAGLALSDAVTPVGRPETDKLTLPPKPFWAATLIRLAPPVPWAMLRLLGDTERLNVGTAVTVTERDVVWVKLPDVPVMVTVAVPALAVLLAVSVRMQDVVAVAGFGLNAAVTPLGSPDANRLTLPVKPFNEVTPMVLVPFAPWAMLRLLGDAERL